MVEKPQGRQVFISYSREDTSLAQELAKAISDAGVRSWLDTEDIHVGERWEEHLQEKLHNARVMVVLLTPSSAQSPWTFFEVGAAVAEHKIIIPVLSKDMNPDNVPKILRHFQFIKASTPTEVGEEVARAIKRSTAEEDPDLRKS